MNTATKHVVTLTDEDFVLSWKVACDRQMSARNKGSRPGFGNDGSRGSEQAVEGAMGECAFHRWLDVPWKPKLGEHDKPDLTLGDVNISIKTRTMYPALLVRPGTPEDWFGVLMVGSSGTYRIGGYRLIGECMRDDWWDRIENERVPCWDANEEDLLPIEDLVAKMRFPEDLEDGARPF